MPSAVIRNYSYDAAHCVLTITFVSGEIYDYFDVPPEVHAGLQQASSRGRYFGSHIRDRFNFARRSGGSFSRRRPEPPFEPDPAPVRGRGPGGPSLSAFAQPPTELRRRTRAVGRPLRPRAAPRV